MLFERLAPAGSLICLIMKEVKDASCKTDPKPV